METEGPECKICRDTEGELIAPCRCSGSCKWVHEACLLRWLHRPGSTAKCEICNTSFNVVFTNQPRGWEYFVSNIRPGFPPALLVLLVASMAYIIGYLSAVLLRDGVFSVLKWCEALPLDFPSQTVVCLVVNLGLVVLKVMLLVSPHFPDGVCHRVTRRIEEITKENCTSPFLPAGYGMLVTLINVTLWPPVPVEPLPFLRLMNLALNVFAAGTLITNAFVIGTPVITKVLPISSATL